MKTNGIEEWMEQFKAAWLGKDIDAVFDLLSDDVEYWETPFQKLTKGPALRAVWEEILPLENMRFSYSIFAEDEEKSRFAISWRFSDSQDESAGTYLIELDNNGLCKYFLQAVMTEEL